MDRVWGRRCCKYEFENYGRNEVICMRRVGDGTDVVIGGGVMARPRKTRPPEEEVDEPIHRHHHFYFFQLLPRFIILVRAATLFCFTVDCSDSFLPPIQAEPSGNVQQRKDPYLI